MNKYLITPIKTIEYEPVFVEADSWEEAYESFTEQDWISDDLTENNVSYDYEVIENNAN